MADTSILRTSPQARTLMSVSLQAESIRSTRFMQQMSGPMPTQAMALAKRERQQTSAHMPIVQIMDLSKAGGDRITMDMFHVVTGLPFMGDATAEGRGANLSFSEMDLIIQQTRFPVNAGGNMSQKRTPHDLRKIARAELANWFARFNEQMMQVHMAGARGSDTGADWIVPLESSGEFSSIAINPVLPPTSNRYFVAGGGDDVTQIGKTDALTLEDLDVIATVLREMPLPPAPIRIEKDLEMNERPLWCLLMTERQWHYIETMQGDASWRSYVAAANLRASITKHPLFAGTTAVWNGIILKRMSRPIRFHGGDTVRITNSRTGVVDTTKQVGADIDTSHQGEAIDRAILLGGQALAVAWGNAGSPMGPFPMNWSEILMDHGNKLEICGGQMEGKKKVRFNGTDGELTDFGCACIDSYSPDPRSEAGDALRTALRS